MKKINKAYIVMAFAIAGLTSCSDFLDKTPSKSSNTPVSTAANLLAVYDISATVSAPTILPHTVPTMLTFHAKCT